MSRMSLVGSGLTITNETRLSILKRAREIIGDRERWTRGYLKNGWGGPPKYCVLGALEQASYDIGLAVKDEGNSFDDSNWNDDGGGPLAYRLGDEISLGAYAEEAYGLKPWRVNDELGYEATIRMLDEYIAEVEAGRPREPLPLPDEQS